MNCSWVIFELDKAIPGGPSHCGPTKTDKDLGHKSAKLAMYIILKSVLMVGTDSFEHAGRSE